MTRCLGDLEFLLDRFEGVGAVRRERGDHVEGHQIAAGDDVAELVDLLRGLRGRIVGREVGGAQGGADLGLGIHHRRASDGHEVGLRVAQGIILLFMLGRSFEPFASRGNQTFDGVVDVLDGFAESGDDRLVGAEFNDLAELLKRDLLGFLHFLGAFVQHLLALGCQQRRSLTGKARALGGQLQAGRETRNVPSAQIDHGPAEMSEHHAGAGADDDRHAGDHGKGGKQAAPDAPSRAQKAKAPEFANGFVVGSYRQIADSPCLMPDRLLLSSHG